MVILETKRLLLRSVREDDAADIFAYSQDPRVGPIAGWQPHQDVQETHEIIRTVFAQPHIFAVVNKPYGRVIGTAGYVDRCRTDIPGRNDEIGYALSPEFWGQGLIPEAVEELIRYGFVERNLDVIWCGHYQGNDQSRRVIKKCGFLFQKTENEWVEAMQEMRTVHLYAMTRKEWAG